MKIPFSETLALVGVVGFVCFAIGYVATGEAQGWAGQHLVYENITVGVMLPGENTYRAVELRSGMTVLDAVAYVMPIKNDLTWVEMYGPAFKTADDRWFEYRVNGELPSVGMVAYQLVGGENIELTLA